ncbi:hypothetical protein AMELA_G00056840 [Ameiurus melas]|uniref:Uncharacterized protein n=1 Tax=Ameiurus melas TaxID=219545 RepID=A0A7J6B0H8_AMEME|nr:hypothetical protein AMELA_G00056840 [Ameiurus melas]
MAKMKVHSVTALLNVAVSAVYTCENNMPYSSVHHQVVFVFVLCVTSITVLALDFTSVKAKLHQSVDLTCEQECSGLVKWVMGNQQELLADCNQTSCSSNKGYQISHHEKRNVLTVMEADYSKRTFFACECNTEDICHVRLCIEPVKSSVQLNPGEDLILALPVPEPVEIHPKSRRVLYQHWRLD